MIAEISFDVADQCFEFRAGTELLCALRPAAVIQGETVTPQHWLQQSDGSVTAGDSERKLFWECRIHHDTTHGFSCSCSVRNDSEAPLAIQSIFFRRVERHDFLSAPATALRLYREGWTMTSATGGVAAGANEYDFDCDPTYLTCAFEAPERFSPRIRNRFTSEYVTLVKNVCTKQLLLAGFVTSKRAFSRFELDWEDAEQMRFQAVSSADGIRLDPGESFASEELMMSTGNGDEDYALLKEFAAIWGKHAQRRLLPQIPCGWCSWYSYFGNVTEQASIENAEFFQQHRNEYPAIEYFQIDAGYQKANGDWLETNEKFPHGLAFLAQEIRKRNLKPGLWFGPFMVALDSTLFQQHPEWMLYRTDGSLVLGHNGKTAMLDASNPEVLDFFEQLFSQLAQMGYEYAKLDFLVYGVNTPDVRRFNPKMTRFEVIHALLQAIRRGFGEERFLMACTSPLSPGVGLVESERIATDIAPRWQHTKNCRPEGLSVPNVCRNLINRTYMHKQLFYNDPDVHIARAMANELTLPEVILWTTALYLAGGVIMLTDFMNQLEPERAKYSQLLLEEPDAFSDPHPLDRFDRAIPSLWAGVRKKDGKKALGVFNFNDSTATIDGTAPNYQGKFYDFWSGRVIEIDALGSVSVELEAHSALLLLAED